MKIYPLIDPYAVHYDSFAGDVYTLDTAGITLTAGTLTANTITDGTAAMTGGDITGVGTLYASAIESTGQALVFKGEEGDADEVIIALDDYAIYPALATTSLGRTTDKFLNLHFSGDATIDGLVAAGTLTTAGIATIGGLLTASAGTTVEGKLYVDFSTLATTPMMERTSAATNATVNVLKLKHTTTGDMADGFGARLRFSGEDDAGTERVFGSVSGVRDGADTEGALVFNAGTGGTEEFARIKSSGNFGINTTSPDAKLQVVGDSRFGDQATNYTQYSATGVKTMHGTARVTKGLWTPFNAIKAPGTKPATFKEWGISGAWEFSDATDDTIVFNLAIPYDMDRSVAPTLDIGWSTNTAVTTETAVWQLEYLYTAAGEDTTAAAQETLTVNSNAVAQADGLVVATITGIDLPSATDVCIHCRIKRLGADGSDDLTDTAELHGICFVYTVNKLGTGL